MTPIRQALTPETLHSLAVTAQRSIDIMRTTGRLASAVDNWANQMIWLQESGTAVKTSPAFADLMTRVDAIQGLQGKVFDVLRRLRDQLVVTLDVAASGGALPIHLLAQLRATIAGVETHADENDVTDLAAARYRRRPVNEAVGELTREAMKICEEMQRLNAAVNTGMLALPTLHCA